MSDEISKQCIHCGLCTRHCLFLEKYKMDLSGFEERMDLAYSCFMCGKCKEVCPKDIDGAAIALEGRKKTADMGKNSSKLQDYRGMLWEKNPYKFSNYRKGKKKSVLFPGCNFPSFFPQTLQCLENIMKSHDIGVVFDCCRKPVYELGLQEDALKGIKIFERRLLSSGVEELVMVCPNCYNFMKGKIGIPMVTVYEKLKELGEGEVLHETRIPIYYPCPDRKDQQFFQDIRFFLDGEIEESFLKIQCCGLGGCAAVKEPELSEKMCIEASSCGSKMYTYCASCVSSFKRKGYSDVYHILSEILKVHETVPLGIQSLINRAKKKIF